ncbi:MAG: hypothetical protein DHS20C15_05770 [Planctomycetota bacterium]|nr:MAG: hypothetical protein DHS20C15_05770 [Planctomycetota bacterium]
MQATPPTDRAFVRFGVLDLIELSGALVVRLPTWRALRGALVLLSCALLTSPPAVAEDAHEQEKHALSEWRASLRKNQNGLPERRAALSQLVKHDTPDVVDALLDHLPKCEIALLPELRRQLAVKREPASLELLRDEGLGSRHASTRQHVALAVGEGLPPHIDWGARLLPLLDDDDAWVRAAAVQSLGRLRYLPATEPIVAAMSSEFAVVRRNVPAALVRLVGERSVSHITRGLTDKSWRVRCATARALGDLNSLTAVKALVERLGSESGRVREELLTSLQASTGKDFAMNLAAWRRWLKIAPRDFATPAQRLAAREKVSASVVADRVDGVPRYYGVATLSSRFLFVTDLSGSMSAHVPDPSGDDEDAVQSRLELAQQELRRLIADLPESMRFNLVTFSGHVRAWSSELAAATPAHKTSARQEISSWSAAGWTNVFDALELAFDLAEAELKGERDAAERAPDTVFLLTDGAPSTGDITHIGLLLAYAAERNRDLDLRFHCVDFAGASHFLRELAEQSGGTVVTPLR